ncbi:hypothetical protein FA15DRAFT_581583 [Coprinopsis marcescibilis]|uniref:gamma-glutamylcyclotransferase n=1 Tax=Coprinopsis marcescibilis TaxID=230819 RepID=A0A5C3LC12_COPMA|nr:hypothetical protein FA15DRAFT_581583 [Coprinopsis marcescibilis]
MSNIAADRPLYFGYGSNLWLDQMFRRCPDSKLRGLARLDDWKWIISERGYANIVPSPGDIVYGLVFHLSQADEDKLDVYENVPIAYVKDYIPVSVNPDVPGNENDRYSGPRTEKVLIYIDHLRITESKPKKEYITRINRGIEDAVKQGVPESYFEKYFRPFIPAELKDGSLPYYQLVAADKPSTYRDL